VTEAHAATAHAATDALIAYALAGGPLPPEVVRAGQDILPDTPAAMIGARASGTRSRWHRSWHCRARRRSR
jgi:hypothetical protein